MSPAPLTKDNIADPKATVFPTVEIARDHGKALAESSANVRGRLTTVAHEAIGGQLVQIGLCCMDAVLRSKVPLTGFTTGKLIFVPPPDDAPDVSDTAPESPPAAAPLPTDTAPLPPAAPPSADRSSTEPLPA